MPSTVVSSRSFSRLATVEMSLTIFLLILSLATAPLTLTEPLEEAICFTSLDVTSVLVSPKRLFTRIERPPAAVLAPEI